MVCGNFFLELWKSIRTIVWLFQYLVLYVCYRLFRCRNSDDVIDAIAEKVKNKHPVEDQKWGRRPKTIR
jgi:hypothetical protein